MDSQIGLNWIGLGSQMLQDGLIGWVGIKQNFEVDVVGRIGWWVDRWVDL